MKNRLGQYVFFGMLTITLGILYGLGRWLLLFGEFWWFDILMHGLVGFWLVYAVEVFQSRHISPRGAFFFLILAAVVWEVPKLLEQETFTFEYLSDTAIDLLMGVLGGLVALLVIGIWNKRLPDK